MNDEPYSDKIFLNLEEIEKKVRQEQEIKEGEICPPGHNHNIRDQELIFLNIKIKSKKIKGILWIEIGPETYISFFNSIKVEKGAFIRPLTVLYWNINHWFIIDYLLNIISTISVN